jgi:HlyD family secretion protein
VDEADIGRIRVGDRVTFTVDAFPARPFSGHVVQIRKAPQVVQNVVTYNVVVGVQNPDLKLLPGMTANVRIVVDQKPSVLKVPNAALRFRPQGVQADGPARGGPQGRPGGGPAAPTAQGRGPAGRVWVVGNDGKPQPVNLQLGISDGNFTEVLDGAVAEGQEVIVGSTERPATAPAGAPRLRL